MSSERYACFPETFSLSDVMSENAPRSVDASTLDIASPDGKQKSECFSSGNFALWKDLEEISRKANSSMHGISESRSGKLKQRWAVDPATQEYLRVVAGCVPILKDSRILLIRSSSGNSWILPKGGWEDDEKLEECAIRETYEESGVVGVLGVRLGTYTMVRRKARAMRVEGEEEAMSSAEGHVEQSNLASLLLTTHVITPDLSDQKRSGNLSHSRVCMSFFPLFVQTVNRTWPENYRGRHAFAIDEAIDIIRPEFRPILRKVKQMGLHLVWKSLQEAT